jgi:hypothetical protein
MSQPLEKIKGPECKTCGCTDSDIIGTYVRWGQTVQKRECNNCGDVVSQVIGQKKESKIMRGPKKPDRFTQLIQALRYVGSEKPPQ